MGYFSNGTEGMAYENEYCEGCVNWKPRMKPDGTPDKGTEGCEIWDLHSLYNYDQNRGKSQDDDRGDAVEGQEWIEKMLDWFIPREGISNLECKMYQARGTDLYCDHAKPETLHDILHGIGS